MEHTQILKDVDNKIFYPIYLLSGEEAYYIDIISDYIAKNALSEEEQGFNQTVFYGKDSDVNTIGQMAKRFPMMANHQVIIIKEAQDLKKIEDLHFYAEKPLESTILVICYKYKAFPKTSKLAKLVKKNGVIFDSPKIRDYKIDGWISNYVQQHKYKIDPETAVLLGDYLGTDLSKIVNELEKLMTILPAGSKISKNDIEKNIGISKDYNIFELEKALGAKDILKVNRILQSFSANPKNHPSVVTITRMYAYYKKLLLLYFVPDKSNESIAQTIQISPQPFVVQQYLKAQRIYPAAKLVQIIGLIREYDLKLKGVDSAAVPEGELMRELAFKILH